MLTLSKPPPRSHRNERVSDLLAVVGRLLLAGRAGEAVEAIGLSYLPCPQTANALAVCHLRLGNTARALRLLRHIATDGAALRPDVPTMFKTNLATALLVAGDTAGCLRTLDEIGEEDHPTVLRLRAAVAVAPRPVWGRCLRWVGIAPSRPLVLDGPIGELTEENGVLGGRAGAPSGTAERVGAEVPVDSRASYSTVVPARPLAILAAR